MALCLSTVAVNLPTAIAFVRGKMVISLSETKLGLLMQKSTG